MKINFITLLIALAVASLAGYGFYAANSAPADVPLANALGGGAALFITLAGAISISAKEGGAGTMNINITSWVFFFVMLVEQIIFSFVPFHAPPYIIVTGMLLIVYILIVYGLGKSLEGAK